MLAAALALHQPDEDQIDRLQRLHDGIGYPGEREIVTIALARCFDKAGRREDALNVLREARESLGDDSSQPSMRLNIARELARLDTSPDYASGASQSLIDYATRLESEMWSLRESQIATLNARREHERLSAEHGAITQQALQDPLTGLPNRRALDEKLRQLASSADAQPLAVALVDLDGFKGVNDKQSHAEGDNVLRVVASTLRDALRGDDLVARYGGDEFIVLLPGTPVSAAKMALGRAVKSVSRPAAPPLPRRHAVDRARLAAPAGARRAGPRPCGRGDVPGETRRRQPGGVGELDGVRPGRGVGERRPTDRPGVGPRRAQLGSVPDRSHLVVTVGSVVDRPAEHVDPRRG